MVDIKLAGLEITIHGREFPDAKDYWDGNLLRASAVCTSQGASAAVDGSILHVPELARWLAAIEAMSRALSGRADLATREPELSAKMEINKLGQINFSVSLTPDHLTQSHRFDFSIDQSHLPPLIAQLKDVLKKFPVKGQR